MSVPLQPTKGALSPCPHGCAQWNLSSSPSTLGTTLVFNFAQETVVASNGGNNHYANQLTLIFGIIAAILAFGSLVFGYLAWKVSKQPGCSCSSKLTKAYARALAGTLKQAVLPRPKRAASYGAGSRFEDGCIEMQDAATWKYYEGIDMPLTPT